MSVLIDFYDERGGEGRRKIDWRGRKNKRKQSVQVKRTQKRGLTYTW
jgi:hypothetical protein